MEYQVQNRDDLDDRAVVDLGQAFGTLWAGKWIIIFFALVVAGAAAALSLQLENKYTSNARMLVDPQNSRIIGLSNSDAQNSVNEFIVESKVHLAQSAQILRQVAGRLDDGAIDTLIGDMEIPVAGESEFSPEELRIRLAMRAISEALTVRPVGTSFLIDVRVETVDPQLSADLANAVAAEFQAAELARKFESAEFASTWLSDRLSQLRDKVTSSENALESFRTMSGDVSERRLVDLSRRVEGLRNQAALNGEVSAAMQDQLEEAESNLRQTTEAIVEMRQLERQSEADQDLYEKLLGRARELQEIVTFQTADLAIVSEAMPPLDKTGPNRKLITLLGLILGGAFGMLVAIIRAGARQSRDRRSARL